MERTGGRVSEKTVLTLLPSSSATRDFVQFISYGNRNTRSLLSSLVRCFGSKIISAISVYNATWGKGQTRYFMRVSWTYNHFEEYKRENAIYCVQVFEHCGSAENDLSPHIARLFSASKQNTNNIKEAALALCLFYRIISSPLLSFPYAILQIFLCFDVFCFAYMCSPLSEYPSMSLYHFS